MFNLSLHFRLQRAKRIIRRAVKNSMRVCVLTGFGKEAMLLKWLLIQEGVKFDCVWFRTDATKEQMAFPLEIIKQWNLTVYSYAPTDRYFIPNGESEITVINEYSIYPATLPVLIDTIHSDKKCCLDLDKQRTPVLNFPWDVCFVGWKKTDSHFATGANPFPQSEFILGTAQIHAPLLNFTDKEVWSLIHKYSIPYNRAAYDEGKKEANTDYLAACTRCVGGEGGKVFCPKEDGEIDTFYWNKEGSLEAFRRKYGLSITQ